MALPGSPEIRVDGGAVRCHGSWTVDRIGQVERALGELALLARVSVELDASGAEAMDTAGAWLLRRTAEDLQRAGRTVVLRLRPEHQRTLELVISSGFVRSPPPPVERVGLVESVGRTVWSAGRELGELVRFLGEAAVTARRALTGAPRVRWRQVLENVQSAGFEALPIAALLSLSIGVVIAHEGASLFQPFGAGVLVADLVGLAMLRELSPLVVAIIAAARSGSGYAAQIGAMKITGEIDSLRAAGASPLEVLALPRIAALAVALPLLTVLADVLGVAGGAVVARSELGIDRSEFLGRIARTIQPSDYLVGLLKAPVFGCVVAAIGCYQGLHAGEDADSVGRCTTAAVVQSLFLVIVADAFFGALSRGFGV
jgi:phospholipid/cholesterol/gamma-HCH transport system permease protein